MITENVEISDVDSNEKWDWREHFGRVVGKDDPIWEKYVQVATTYNEDIIGTIGHSMDIHLVFSGLFSAVITTLIVQSDSGLLPQDQEASLMKTLGKVFYDQFNLALQILQSSGDRPSFPYIPPDDYSVNESLFYWYISLDLSLVIASGAVCMKIWLFEYRRRSKLHHVPYHYAIHHQQSCASLRRWFIFEFGDLLGCILLLDIILFFYGCSLQFTGKSYNMILTSVSNVAFGVCTALLMFVTVVGIFVPDSPYRTPISNFLQRVPRILGGYLRTDRERQHHFLLFLVFSAGIGTAAISGLILGTKEATIGYFLIICSPIILTIPFGLRDGLKMGRISHFVPLMSLSATLMLICVLLVIAVPRFRGSYYRLPYEPGLYRSGAFGILIPFIFTTIVLSHRFSTVKSRQNFPVLVFMLSCFGVVVALLLYEHLLLLQVVMAWASVVILLITSLQHEMDIEEDTREAEALGWLIGQARDRQILHSALVCIPSIANTPSRRKIISQRAHTTLSSLINAVVHASQQNCPAIIEEKRSDHNPEVNFCDRGESFLAFYLTCLSEVIGTEVRRTVKGEETPNPLPQRAPIPKQWWLQRNWYRLLTIPPSNRDIMREYCFPHDWYPFLSPSPPHSLQVDLEILSEHHNSYIRTVSQAVKSQLYPSTSSLDQIGNWPMLEDSQVLPLSFHRKYVILVELRMATAHAIEVCRHKKSQEPSLMRYLQRYCVTALNFWRVVELPQAEQFLVTALNLAFVVMERNHKAVFVASLGDAVTMKVARCIMALKRFHDSSLELGLDQADGDAQLRIMLTQAVLSALQHYLEVNLRCIARIRMLVLIERANGVDESSIVSGMQYLEYALFQIASQECSAELMKALISSLDTLFRIGDIVDIPFHPADPSCNIIPLMRHLKIQASTSELDSDRASALQVTSRILHKVSSDSMAWSLVLDDDAVTLPDIIATMAQSPSTTCRSAGLSALLTIRIFHPLSASLNEKVPLDNIGTRRHDTHPETELARVDYGINPELSLDRLYNIITSHPSPLFQAISASVNSLDINLISTSLAITSSLIESPGLKHYVSDFIYRDGYAEALASVASSDDTDLIPASVRQSSIYLFARLWKLADECRSEEGIGDRVEFGRFYPGGFIKDIAKGVDAVVDGRESVELECIELWLERLQAIRATPQIAVVAEETQLLVVALRRAVPFSSFRKPVEARRAAASLQLLRLSQ